MMSSQQNRKWDYRDALMEKYNLEFVGDEEDKRARRLNEQKNSEMEQSSLSISAKKTNL